jgi:GT2 family glycosyltransferase
MSGHPGTRAPVAVVVVSWNSASWLTTCLASLRELERPPAEVVVVDNGSSDRSAEGVRSGFPEADLLSAGANTGFCRANNLGIARTTSPFVLVLNPDTRLTARFLEELLPAFDDPTVGIACGKLLRFDERTLDSAGQSLGRSRQPKDRGYGEPDRGQFDRDEAVFGACAAAALYRRTMLASVADGPDRVFDERFFAFNEDLDLAWRARRLGWRAVYRHRALGFHARGSTADSGTAGARGPALLRRPAAVRFHIVKNRWLTILRNDSVGAWLRDSPFILARDAATFLLLLLSGPSVLVRLWRERHLFRESRALGRRDRERPRLDSGVARHHVDPGGETGRTSPPDGGSRDPTDSSLAETRTEG